MTTSRTSAVYLTQQPWTAQPAAGRGGRTDRRPSRAVTARRTDWACAQTSPRTPCRQTRWGRLGETGEFDVEGYRVRRISLAPARGQFRSGDVSATAVGDTLHLDIGQ
jgi:hypothetical protein